VYNRVIRISTRLKKKLILCHSCRKGFIYSMPPITTPAATPRTLPNAVTAYSQFQRKLAWHGIRQFAASLRGSAEVIFLVAGQVLLGVLALLSGPLWLCAFWLQRGHPAVYIIALWLGHSALMALPIWLLRQRLLPPEVVLWSRALPLPPKAYLRAHATTVALLVQPLALAYFVSSLALLSQSPDLVPLWPLGVALQLSSLVFTFGLGLWIFHARRRKLCASPQFDAAQASNHRAGMAVQPFSIRPLRPRLMHVWHRLFWLPFWRMENGIGLQQCVLFGITCLMFALWLVPVSPLPRGILGWFASSAILVLTDQGYKAVQEQMQLMTQHLRTLPLRLAHLKWLVGGISLLPAALILCVLGGWFWLHGAQVHGGVARWYLGTQVVAHLGLLAAGRLSEPARARILILSMVILTAMGTELWQ
jgi:hypothetical protein